MTTSLRKIPGGVVIAACALPYIWIAGILGLAARARLHLGYWPRPAFPDPKQLPFDVHQGLLWINFIALEWSIPIVAAAYMICRFLLGRQPRLWPYRAYVMGWILIFTLWILPGIDFVAWFMD